MKTLQLLALMTALGASTVLAAAQTFDTLYTFETGANGGSPTGLLASNGVLYGVTEIGGAYGNGTVFELQAPAEPGGTWTETVLYSFTGQNGDGARPFGGLVAGGDGALYGTTQDGGDSDGDGTVFKLAPPADPGGAWTESVIYSFDGSGGYTPAASLVLGADGTLYGTTQVGGAGGYGTVFALRRPGTPGGTWTETVLYTFTG
jgi:uncharacterized repeat protein (TIGR03803 family)